MLSGEWAFCGQQRTNKAMIDVSTYKYRIKRSLRGCRLRPSIGLCLFEEGYCADVFGYLISLPFLDRWHHYPDEIMERWGAYYQDNAVVFNWKNSYKFIHMPWDWDHIKTEVRRPDETWAKKHYSWDGGEPDDRWGGTYPYTYTLKNGTVQERLATIFVERREWRRKFLKWCPLFAKVRISLDISFNGEVGEQSGSWKGGTIGCGWDLKKGESPLDALRRMEKERKFT